MILKRLLFGIVIVVVVLPLAIGQGMYWILTGKDFTLDVINWLFKVFDIEE